LMIYRLHDVKQQMSFTTNANVNYKRVLRAYRSILGERPSRQGEVIRKDEGGGKQREILSCSIQSASFDQYCNVITLTVTTSDDGSIDYLDYLNQPTTPSPSVTVGGQTPTYVSSAHSGASPSVVWTITTAFSSDVAGQTIQVSFPANYLANRDCTTVLPICSRVTKPVTFSFSGEGVELSGSGTATQIDSATYYLSAGTATVDGLSQVSSPLHRVPANNGIPTTFTSAGETFTVDNILFSLTPSLTSNGIAFESSSNKRALQAAEPPVVRIRYSNGYFLDVFFENSKKRDALSFSGFFCIVGLGGSGCE